MNYTLTEEASLFFIDQAVFEEFSEQFEKSCRYSSFDKGLLQEVDVVHQSFNIWLIMQSEKKEVMESMEKTMYYTGDFLILDAIRKDNGFIKIQKLILANQELLCPMAAALANELNVWMFEKMSELKNLSFFNNLDKSYYLLYKEPDLWENRVFLDEVSIYTKKVTNALADKRSFQRIFQKIISQYEQLAFKQLEVNQIEA